MRKLKEIAEKLAALVKEERAQLERIKAEGREFEATEQEQYEKRAAEIDKLEQERQKLAQWEEREARNAKMEASLSAPLREPVRESGDKQQQKQEWRDGLHSFLRRGETRALVVGDASKGGYLAPAEFVKEILKTVTEITPFRSLARIHTTTNESAQWPRRTGQFAAVWTGEVSTRSESTGLAFGLETIQTHEMTAIVDVSQQDIEDSVFDVEAFVRNEASEQFSLAENTSFITGNGVLKPFGITTDPNMVVVKSGSSGDFDADDLIDLLYSLKSPYVDNATFLFNRTTLRKIRKLKANNEYIWTPAGTYPNNVATGLSPTLLGRPVVIAAQMPSTGTAAAKSVACGDFGRGYLILDRIQMGMTRDPYTQAATGTVRFWFRKRVGGQIIMSEAFNVLSEEA